MPDSIKVISRGLIGRGGEESGGGLEQNEDDEAGENGSMSYIDGRGGPMPVEPGYGVLSSTRSGQNPSLGCQG